MLLQMPIELGTSRNRRKQISRSTRTFFLEVMILVFLMIVVFRIVILEIDRFDGHPYTGNHLVESNSLRITLRFPTYNMIIPFSLNVRLSIVG